MSGYFVKNPDSELELPVDWRAGYLRRNEQICDDLGWSIRPVSEVSGELKIVLQECDHKSTRARFTDGLAGQIYMVSSKVRTSEGREMERSFVFRVADKELL